jgi:hypothetical protein
VSTDSAWHNTLSDQVEDSWQALLELSAACIEENLIDARLAHFELMRLNDRLTQAKEAEDQAQLEACLSKCKQLLSYYRALQRQRQRLDEPGSPFLERTLEPPAKAAG